MRDGTKNGRVADYSKRDCFAFFNYGWQSLEGRAKGEINLLKPNSDQHQFSPSNITYNQDKSGEFIYVNFWALSRATILQIFLPQYKTLATKAEKVEIVLHSQELIYVLKELHM